MDICKKCGCDKSLTIDKKCPICPEESSSASVDGSTACDLVDKKLTSLRQRYSKACNENDHMEGIVLYAQIGILESMWLDFVRLAEQ